MSAQLLKQLKIKTSTVKRLKKQYISYEQETQNIKQKIKTMEESEPKGEQELISLKKNKQFLEESESVLSNVKQKFIEGFEALANFLNEKQGEEALEGTEEKQQAEQIVLDAETFLEGLND